MAYRLTFSGTSEAEQVIVDAEEAHALWDRTVAAMNNSVSEYTAITFADDGRLTKQHAVAPRAVELEPVIEVAPKVVTKKR